MVVVNHDYERYLGEAIDSALAQSHPSVEVVVVDDGSTDGSRALIAGYGDRVIPVLQDNGGQGSAINAGFAASSGDLVCFLDGDDALEPIALAAAAAELQREPFAKVHWPLREVDAAGRDLGALNPIERLDSGDLCERVLGRGPGAYVMPPCSGNAFARPTLTAILPVPDELVMGADVYPCDLAPLFGRIAALETSFARYRKHGRSNFGDRPFDVRFEHGLRLHRRLLTAMAARARALGREPDEAHWRERAWYLRLERFLAELDRAVPPGTPFGFFEPERLGPDYSPRRRLMAIAQPADERAAGAELERVRRAGARFLVVGWPSFSRFDESPWPRPGPPVRTSDLIRVFDLTRGA